MRMLITGGAGFVGSRLAMLYRDAEPQAEIVAFDNLKRRGAELNLPLFAARNISFVHGDVRSQTDLDGLPGGGGFDIVIDAAAEPSVHAGTSGSPSYVLETNLGGTLNLLEAVRMRGGCGAFLFLSTSRVYSIAPLRDIALTEGETRFEIGGDQSTPGITPDGISESFPTDTARSLYGASKLASELIVQEYAETYKIPAVINRCGVIAGPGQFGKIDQGVFTLWVANHYFNKGLRYTGFGGQGKQVRDLLHPDDLFRLLRAQMAKIHDVSGQVFNAGGGRHVSVSLAELTTLCQKATGRSVPIGSDLATSAVDIPLYLSDSRKAANAFGWAPHKDPAVIVDEIADWLASNESALRPLFGA
jgi:CDP-paratose 2-epimerase